MPKDGLPRVLLLAVATGFSASTSGEPEEGLSEIEWDEFFAIFKKSKLSFLYQDDTSGGKTNHFNKLSPGRTTGCLFVRS